jgi:hypothetical protein
VSGLFYEVVSCNGLAAGYLDLVEIDFTAAAGPAYSPPERGDFRRIVGARQIQLLQDSPGVIETFQLSAATVRLPANTLSDDTNDSRDGRIYWFKNSGTGSITIQDYLGTTLWTIKQYAIVVIVGNDNNNWDFYFTAKNIDFSNAGNYFTAENSQAAIEEAAGPWLAQFTKESTGFVYSAGQFTPDRTTITFSEGSRQFSISPKSPYTSILFLINSRVFSRTGPDITTIADNEGAWYIYYDSTGSLVSSQTPWTFNDSAFVAFIYWDQVNKKAVIFGDERHGCVMDWRTHERLHRATYTTVEDIGLDIGNYIENGDGSLNSHAQYSISDGYLWDEDIRIYIKNSASPVNPFEQILSPIAQIPVLYMTGAGLWRKKVADTFPIYQNPPGTAYYNRNTAGTWSLQSCTNDYFFATWLVYTNDIRHPAMVILGQREDSDLISAINNNTRAGLMLPSLPSQEIYFYKKIIWQTNTTYGNTPKARIRYVASTLEINPANDRYSIICNYNGNAGTGKYLDFYPGQSSNDSPFPVPESSYIRTITLSATASSTGTVSIYKSTDLATPIISVSLTASVYTKYVMAYPINADDKLVAKVSSGSFNKPAMTMFIQTNL